MKVYALRVLFVVGPQVLVWLEHSLGKKEAEKSKYSLCDYAIFGRFPQKAFCELKQWAKIKSV